MAIKIFDVDPEGRSPKGFSEDLVGRFRSGAQVNGTPTALEAWRVTTGDPEVADKIADLYGGMPQDWETTGEDNVEVFTQAHTVRVILAGPDAIKTGMALWGRKGLIHACDGEMTTEGVPCPMAGKTVAERKEAAKAGVGCQPNIGVYFKLADDPDLGKFRFNSGSWKLAEEIEDVEDNLADVDGPALATLRLELVEYTTKRGRHVSYTKPVIKILGSAE